MLTTLPSLPRLVTQANPPVCILRIDHPVSMSEQNKVDLFDLESLSQSDMTEIPDPFYTEEAEGDIQGDKYVLFQIAGQNYAIATDRISEVVRVLPVTSFPNLPAWFLGIANLRGDILTIVELPVLWDIEIEPDTPKEKLIVLQPAESNVNLAFRVDRLREIIVLDAAQMEEPKGKNGHHFLGVSKYRSQNVQVLDVDEIIHSLAIT